MIEVITSLQNPKIKEASKLWKRSYRDETDTFLIEGFRELSRAVEAGLHFHHLFICPELFLGESEGALIEKIRLSGAAILPCAQPVFSKLSYRDRPDGLLAVARQFHTPLSALQPKALPFYVVAEAIEKPGNLGTILRTSDATGVDGVIVCDRCTDLHNPNVVRASVGTLFTQPVVDATTEQVLAYLKEQKVAIVAATPSAQKLYSEVDLTQPVAIVVGTEQYGLSNKFLNEADLCVKIPMLGSADSLNVAMATTVLLYEVVRQRTR